MSFADTHHGREQARATRRNVRLVRSPLTLAALTTVAVPGLDVHDVIALPAVDSGFDEAVVIGANRERWIVRSPSTAAAGATLEGEVALLASFGPHIAAGTLPFAVPAPVGFAPLPEGGRAVVFRELAGTPVQVQHLRAGPGLAAALGRSLAALHELPTELVETAGLPSYTAAEYRERKQAEVDEAAKTGRIPARLLRRWENALENVAMWRFQPTIVHGDINSDTVLVDRAQVKSVLNWGNCKVADPADDLSWLLVAAPEGATESILESYQMHRTESSDKHLVDRALLDSELALARWLLHGVRNGLSGVVNDAVEMLLDLDEATAPSAADPAED